jgi:glycosyltransferase involved in cell wall biosynthesis
MTHLLVLEPEADGHPLEWLQHLVACLREIRPSAVVSFVVARELFAPVVAAIDNNGGGRMRVIALEPREQARCRHRSLIVSGFARWLVMRRYLRRTGADAGHFMGLDHLSLPLALGLGAHGRRLSGILFRPSVHYAEISAYRPRWRERLRDARKAALYRLMLRNPALARVLSLDPYFPAYAARRYRGGAKVAALPDPVCPVTPGGRVAAATQAAAPSNRFHLLMFGALTARKGVMQLLDALERLDDGIAARLAVVVAGRVEPALAELFKAATERLRRRRALQFHAEQRWLSRDEIAALLGWSDAVLAPYQRFVGSSGVMLWAAAAGKPLVTQDFGLLGRLVADHRLGLAVDSADPGRLAAAIASLVERGTADCFDAGRAAAFAAERTPRRFAAEILAVHGIGADATVST